MSLFGKKELSLKDDEIKALKEKLADSETRQKFLKSILFDEICDYINDIYIEPSPETFEGILFQTVPAGYDGSLNFSRKLVPEEIEEVLENVEASFSEKLFELIREKNLSEVEVYKKADIDRRHFSKIRSDCSYRPTKDTVILLCLSMKLSFEEAEDLLNRAGLALSKSSKQDIIAEYFLKRRIYDILLYKEVLFEHGFIRE